VANFSEENEGVKGGKESRGETEQRSKGAEEKRSTGAPEQRGKETEQTGIDLDGKGFIIK